MVHTDPKTQPSGKTNSAAFARRFVIPFLVLFCCIFQTANATHFRYGTVNWSRANSSTNTVTFTLNQVWRTSFGWGTTIAPGAVVQPGTFSFGDGSSISLSLTVTSVNASEDWFSGTATVTHTYPSAGSYTADFSNCCRLSNLQNNNDENFRTETQVILNNGNNASPVSSLPPIVYLPPATVAASFQVPALDPDGDPYTFSLSTSTQQGGAALTQPAGFSISPTGLATLNTVGKTVGQIYNASIRVTDSKGAATTVDFIMKIANQVSPPYFDYTDVPPPLTPLNNTTFYIQPGQTLTFNVTGRDNDALDVVNVLSSSLPSGSVLAPQTGTNPAQRVFTWTPTINQLGTYILSFDLIDGQGTHAISPTFVNIVVSTNPLFDVGPTPPNNSTECIKPGTKYFATIQAHSPDTAVTVSITATSLPGNANFRPNPTDPANVTVGELNWAPTAANWGPNNMSFIATDALGNTATHTYTMVVNSPPVFTTTQGNTTISVGQLFTYTVAATDADIPYGDQLEIHDVTLPSWLTYTDNGDGTYTLSGTPTAADLGPNQVHLEAEDIYHHCYAPTEQIFTITVEANPLVIDIQAVSTCGNANNGAVSVAVTGGTAPYAYRWSSTGTGATDVSAQTGSSITGLAPGTYTVTITDNTGVSGTATADVINTFSSFTVSPNIAICPGGSTTLTASGADIYSWSTGENTASITVSPASTTVYTVTGYVNSSNLVTNGDFSSGNTGFSSDYVYVSPADNAATPLSGGTHTGLVPEGVYAVDGNAHDYHPAFEGLDHTTGTGTFFMITNGSGTPNTTVWSQTINNILPNTTYYFSTWVTSVNPDSPAELNFSINGQPLGSTFTAPAGVSGTWVQFYQTWNSGSSTVADIAIVNQNVTLGGNDFGLDDISFTTVCPDTRTVTVTISPVPTVSAGPDQIICPGASVTLHASGTKGDRFLWSTGDTTQNVLVTPAATTTYTVTVTNALDCTGSDDVTITIGDTTPPTANCKNITVQLVNGTATITGADINNGSTDNCSGTLTYAASPATFTCANAGPNTVTLTVTDVAGNTATCEATVTVEDGDAPIALCKNVTIQLDANGEATVTAGQVDNGSSDACGTVRLSVSPSTFNCQNVGPNQVTLTAFDANGNSASCNATVTVEDTSAPNAYCNSITVQLDATGHATITSTDLDSESSDVCGISSIVASDTSFDCSNIGDNRVILTVTDNHGNVSTCTALVTVEDHVAPTALCQNVTVQLDGNGQATVTAAQVDNGSSDACGIASISVSPSNFTCANVGPNTVTLTVTDNNGNTATCNAVVTVAGTVTPTAVCKNITVQLDANGDATITAAQVDNGSSAVCGVASLSVSPSTFNCNNVGPNQVTLTVTDNNGNTATCNATVTVEDTSAPNAYCNSITVQLDATGNVTIASSDLDSQSSDVCGISSIVASDTTFDCSNIGDNRVTLTVTDNHGNVSTCTALVTVEDHVAPTALCQNVTVQLDGNGQATVTAAQVDNGSSDACGIASISVSPSTFTCANVGPNNVTLTVTDNNGNTATCNATVTVAGNSTPVAVCKNVTVQLDGNGQATVTAAQIDNGSSALCGVASLSVSPSTFNCSNVGPNQVTLTVTDNNGNTATCTATVTVEDNTAPILGPCPADVTITALTNNCFNNHAWTKPLFSENCSGATLSVTASDPTVIIFDFGSTFFASFPVGTTTVTQTVTDAHGNSDDCSFTVTVVDRQNPIITGCPGNITVNATATQCSAQAFWNQPTASDNCPGVSLTGSAVSGDVFPLGTTTVTYTATDAHGNSAPACTFTVTVRDASGPQAICKAATVDLNANGSASITAAQVDNGSFDNCTAVTLSVSPSTFTCANIGANNVTLTATDANGNTATCTAVVTVRDVTPPVAICKNITVALGQNGTATVTAAQINNGSYDNCGPVTLSAPSCNFTCANVGPNNVTLTVRDASGNTSTCTAVVTVTGGGSSTTVSCRNITVDLNAQGVAEITAAQVSNGASGPCGSPVTLTVTPNRFTCANVGANTVTLTANDGNGHTATCTATVTVRDVTPPTAICRNKTVALVNGTATITAAQINNGSYDNCGVTSVTISKTTFNCGNIGANQVTLTVRDAAGNTSTCTATVTVTGQGLSCSIASVPTSSCAGTGGNPNNIYIGYGPQSTRLQVSVTGGGAPYTYSWSPSNRLSCSTCANPTFTPNAPGNYTFTVTVRNSNGCTTTCDITICVLDIRVPANNGCGYSSDKVYVCHIPPGNHNNPQTISISVNAVSAHVPLHGGDHLGRCNQTCGNNKTEDEDGVAELISTEEGGFEMIVYPNPFRDQFRLKVETESKEPVDVRMFSITGQLMNEQKNVSFTEDLYFGYNLPNGVYLVEVKQGDYSKVVRMTKAE